MAAITIKNMDVTYNKGKSYVIKDMNLEIKDGEFCVFLIEFTRFSISSFGAFFVSSANDMFLRTVMFGYSAYSWNTIAMLRSCGGTNFFSLPRSSSWFIASFPKQISP